MAKELNAERVVNGSFGEVWFDGEYLSECKKLSAKVEIKKEAITKPGTLKEGQKMIGISGKGSMTIYKVNSKIAKKVSDYVKVGKLPVFQILSTLRDPAAYGAERVNITGATPDDLTLAEWETAKAGEVEIPFTFEDWEFLDTIEEPGASLEGSISVNGLNISGSGLA